MTPVVKRRRAQLDWMAHVRVGDVLVSGRGSARVAREVTRFKDGDLRSITFAIRRCSWTTRGYTILNFTDLRQHGFRHTGVNVPLTSDLDAQLEWAIAAAGTHLDIPNSVTCCLAKDMP